MAAPRALALALLSLLLAAAAAAAAPSSSSRIKNPSCSSLRSRCDFVSEPQLAYYQRGSTLVLTTTGTAQDPVYTCAAENASPGPDPGCSFFDATNRILLSLDCDEGYLAVQHVCAPAPPGGGIDLLPSPPRVVTYAFSNSFMCGETLSPPPAPGSQPLRWSLMVTCVPAFSPGAPTRMTAAASTGGGGSALKAAGEAAARLRAAAVLPAKSAAVASASSARAAKPRTSGKN